LCHLAKSNQIYILEPDGFMSSFSTLFIYILVFTLGASIGSFLSVVVHRVPAGKSIWQPPSHCPACGYRLKPYENVPIIGWLALRGQCSNCGSAIALRYPMLEAACGIAFVGLFALSELSWQTLGNWLLFSWLLALALIDIDTMTLPNPLTISGLAAGLLFQSIVGFADTASISGGIIQLMHGIIGAVLGIWLLEAISLLGTLALGQTAMGGGDAKLAAMMGAWLGWKLLLVAGFLACAIGAFAGGGAIALGLLNRRQPFPFGPFLALGGIITAVWGNSLLSAYLSLFFPA
jgi:leader peptidase (prepilin peptidase) / N-methyltransferase